MLRWDLLHAVDLGNNLRDSALAVEYIESINQRADIFTKAFGDAATWKIALDAIKIGLVKRTPDGKPAGVIVPPLTDAMPVGHRSTTTVFRAYPHTTELFSQTC